MKLHDVPRNSYVRISDEEVRVPPAAPDVKNEELIFFDHIDGMYSLCIKVDPETLSFGEVCHIAAWTEVSIVEIDELFTFEQIRQKIGRSGYGKDGTGEYREANLENMSDGWVEGAIDFVPQDHPHLKYYIQELEYRKKNNISIPDTDA